VYWFNVKVGVHEAFDVIFDSVAGLAVALFIVPPPVQVQLVNVYPVFGVAVSVVDPPEVTLAEVEEVDPPVPGFKVIVNTAVKVGVHVAFEVIFESAAGFAVVLLIVPPPVQVQFEKT
jgi:hypothetical protein